ncbi:MAG: hypothetical protein KH126_07585 [Azospirillum sp.]|nr:hypothetical protein [Azospirillum sp.]
MKQFDEILEQIDGIAKDSGYKGVNLLEKDQELKVVFNEDRSSSLTVKSDDASSEGLGLHAATGAWTSEAEKGNATEFKTNGKADAGAYVFNGDKVYEVKKNYDGTTNAVAFNTLVADGSLVETDYKLNDDKSKAIEVTISKDKINTSITEVEDAVSKADMNEESANMLALQTRQQLAINSLSLASQAAQSVLSLF